MPRLDRKRLEALLDGFRQVRLVIVGDVVLDEYLWGDVDRVSPEAPVPVVHVQRESRVLGGAGNVVRNVAALGGACHFCAVVGDDAAGAHVRGDLEKLGIDPAGIVVADDRPTTRKTRVLARSQQVVRFDRESTAPISPADARRLLRSVEQAMPQCHGAVLEDYGKGVLSGRVLAAVMRRFRDRALPVAVDPKSSLRAYRGAALLKPNLREAEELTGMRARTPRDVEKIASRLRRAIGGGALVVTRGSQGMTLFEDDGPGIDVHTVAREVFDVQGAGDTTIAALALALRAGGALLEAAVIANAAAGVVVGKVGTATARPDEVRALLPAAIRAAGEVA